MKQPSFLSQPGKTIAVSKFGELLGSTYGNARCARTVALNLDLTTKGSNMDKSKGFFKICESFHLVTFLGSCQNLFALFLSIFFITIEHVNAVYISE